MSDTTPSDSIAVIGAGWAGLSAAWHLCQAGRKAVLYEMAPITGGRARHSSVRLGEQTVRLDNGQHLMIGAYRDSLALIRQAHGLAADAPIPGLLRLPLQIESPRMGLRARQPGQLGLLLGVLRARGLTARSRMDIVRMGVRLRLSGWSTPVDETVQTMLTRLGQSTQACSTFWAPLCLAALNTPIETASAQVFVNVLHDSLFSGAGGSDFLIATEDLGALFAETMTERLVAQGVSCHLATPITAIHADGANQWQIHRRDHIDTHQAVVLATSSTSAARLLEPVVPAAARALGRLRHEAIQTVYLAWPQAQAPALPPLTRLDDDAAAGQPAQWLFARGPQQGLALAAAVISLPSADVDSTAVATMVARQLEQQLGVAAPVAARTINEKRATFSCVPGRPVADHKHIDGHPLPAGLRLAGDYCWARYPSTLEGAVRSGAAAAAAVLAGA